jgi:hypothetical protein
VANDVGRWRAGQLLATELRPSLSDASTVFAAAAMAVDQLPTSPAGEIVNRLYRSSVALDQEWMALTMTALDMPPGPLAQQVVLAASRVRELGDRIFDRGRAPLELLLPSSSQPGVNIVLPAEVPDWVAEGLAAGPPLDAVPPPPSGRPSVRPAHRPEQPRARWEEVVATSGAPSVNDLPASLAAPDAARLADLSHRWLVALDRMRSAPDPKGDREGSERLYLQWLVAAESARVGQAAVMASGGAGSRLLGSARHLARIAHDVA